MSTSTRRPFLRQAAHLLGASLLCVGTAHAADYPRQAISLIVPFPPGGATDATARLVAGELSRTLQQSVVVENLSGASGAIAGQKAAQAQPDGYTLLLGTVNDVVLAPVVNQSVKYSHQSFTPLGIIAETPFALVAHPSFPADDIDGAIAHLRAHPETVSLGVPGIGTLQHVAGAMIGQQTNTRWTTVPYRGAAPLTVDLLSGQINLGIVTLPSALQYIQAGKLKPLGILRAERDPTVPELATINEGQTVKDINTVAWLGLFAPVGLPEAIQQQLNDALNASKANPTLQQALSDLGNVPAGPDTLAQAAAYVAREHARYEHTASALVAQP